MREVIPLELIVHVDQSILDAPLVAIDPDAGNLRARRAFARAGFAEDAVVEAKQGMVVLMMFGGDAP